MQNQGLRRTDLGYLRAPDGLKVLSCRMLRAFDASEELRSQTLALLEPFAALERTAVTTPGGDPQAKALFAAWGALSAVGAPSPKTSAALRTILTQTVPAVHAPAPRPFPFAALGAPTPPKPTAAHPRAFQGTIHQPPKEKRLEPIDLRPFLCDRAAVQDLIAHFIAAAPFLAPREDGPVAHDLNPEWPPLFTATFGPTLRAKPWSEISAAHALFQRLALERNASLLACVAALFGRSQYATGWCEIIAHLPPDQQTGFAGLLLDTDAGDADPATGGEGFDEIVWDTAQGPSPTYRVYCLLRGLAHGVRARYLREGFRLNDRLETNHAFHHITQGENFPAETLHAILDTLESGKYDDDAFDRWKFMDIWRACGEWDGLAALIKGRDWSRWRPEISAKLLSFYSFTAFAYEDKEAEVDRKRPRVMAYVDRLEAALTGIAPEYQWKFIDSMESFVRLIELEDFGAHCLPDACALLMRLCRPPCHPRRNLAHVWLDYIAYFDAEQRATLIMAPDACYQQMEKSCRTTNTSSLIGSGGMSFAKAMPAFTLACFLSATTHFFRTAKVFGCLSDEEGLTTAQSFAREPFMQADLENLSDAELYDWIAAREEPNLFKAIPKELWAHYEGASVLSTPRLSHYHAQMRRQWLRACLGTMENGIYDRLARGFEVESADDNARHALQLQMRTNENRQALKKMLAAHWAGRADYVAEHPQTRQWLKMHPALNVDLWCSGISYARTIEPYGLVTITIERDPLEALKLGTYVGSCLGLGGAFAFSAAATVLDINKQVLYARDATGAVIGRQVVAYAESGEMVCFYVYPHSAPDPLRSLFADYNRQFAAALGVTIFRTGGDSEYWIRHILSHDWWDDGAVRHEDGAPKSATGEHTPTR